MEDNKDNLCNKFLPPWIKIISSNCQDSNMEILPAHYTVQHVLEEIFTYFERRLNHISEEEALDKPLNKSIRRGEESYFLGLLRTLTGLCETCLPSILTAFLKWYEYQQKVSLSEIGETRDKAVKKTLTASYLFSIVLIEILPQIHFHPTDCETQINFIISTSFKQISCKDPAMYGITYNNSLLVAEIFAEVIGVLSQSHAKQIEKTFLDNLSEFRKEPPTPTTVRAIVCLLMGMKYYRVKTNQISSLEQGIAFLDEIGSYYLEVDLKQKDLKHALAGLLVEILLPLAAQIKTEANVPALIAFVDKLYGSTYDLVNKKQHKMAAYPLLTCLLCISQNKFFLSTWVQFLNLSLANLKNKDPKISRMALESLYRLIWVYTVRISCEGNSVTRSRLESICGSLFPRGSRNVVPRDAPLNIFVKIIHFIAQYKIDFAFKEIIYDLLGCCSRSTSRTLSIYPERMNIGIRALMVIVDGLQQKESPPGMPRPIVPLYGTVQRTKRSYLTQPLSTEIARSLGLEQYFSPCRKAFDAILRTLDAQIGRPFMLTAPHVRSKDYNEVMGAELKAKFDLFRTCIAAIPRLLPDPMPYQDLIEFLIRMCVHVDEEIRLTAYQSLQNLMTECQEWREDLIHIFLRFFTNQIQDTFPTLLESMVRLLLQLLCIWKSSLLLENQKKKPSEKSNNTEDINVLDKGTLQIQNSPSAGGNYGNNKSTIGLKMMYSVAAYKMGLTSTNTNTNSTNLQQDEMSRSILSSTNFSTSINNNLHTSAFAIHCLEGLAICLLCQIRAQTKRMAISILYEAKQLLELLSPNGQQETPIVDVLEEAMPDIIEKYLPHVDEVEKKKWSRDLFSFCEQISNLEPNLTLVNEEQGNEYFRWDPWACVLSGYCQHRFLLTKCTIAISFAWPALLIRFNQCNQIIDPNNPQNENRSSLLRSSKSKSSNWPLCGEILSHENYLSLWQKYIVLVYGLLQSSSTVLPNLMQFRSFSPSVSGNNDANDVNRSMISSVRMTRTASLNCSQLLQRASMMIRWEPTDIRDSIVLGIGSINPESFEMLLEEFHSKGIFREANERKNESNLRRKKRKELLRLQLLRILEVAVYRGLLDFAVFDRHTGSLTPLILEFIESIRFHVEMDMNRDISTNMRLHFAKVITQIVKSIPLDLRENLIPWDLRRALFFLFFSWCSRTIAASTDKKKDSSDVGVFVEQRAIEAMCALSSCGNIFECHDSSSFGEDYIFRWLEAILASNNSTVNTLCEELLCTILHLNENHPQIFEKIVQLCYTRNEQISSRCFRALALLFSQRDYPCEFISLLCLCGTFVSDAESIPMRQTAFHFIQLLRQQFLDVTFSPQHLTASSPFAETIQESDKGKRIFLMNQTMISRQLAGQYTQLTMPIFSEICLRIETARPNMQSSMLSFFQEWMKNICLVAYCDIPVPEATLAENMDGWGSEEATQLLLNNLIYLTDKLANEHDHEIGELWKCLAAGSLSNLAIIVHFLMVMMTLSLDNMLPLVKRISGYIFQATDEQYIGILIEELQNIGTFFKLQLCRSEMPPYYRWLNNVDSGGELDESKEVMDLSADTNISTEESNESNNSKMQQPPSSCTKTPKQLPMPPYGGNYSRLSALLPPTTQTIQPLARGKLALFLLCDLLALKSANSINWDEYLPKLLHMAIINLDSIEPITCFHARQTIINIISMFASNNIQPPFQMATILIKNQLKNQSTSNETKLNELENINLRQNRNNESSSLANEENVIDENASFAMRGGGGANMADYKEQLLKREMMFSSRLELLKALLFTLSFEQFNPLWDYEETTQRNWVTESAKCIAKFTQHLAAFLTPTISELATNWTNFAIEFALKTSNKHFAGRSFQIAGALGHNPESYIEPFVSRLVEIVADNSDEMQSYIIDMFKCLEKMAQSLNTRNNSSVNGHCRSISYTTNLILDSSPVKIPNLSSETKMQKKDMRHSLLLGNEFLSPQTEMKKCGFLIRSKSATTLKLSDTPNVMMNEEELNTFTRILLITLPLLESNLDNEFLLALHTLDKLLYICGSQRLECLTRLEAVLTQNEYQFHGIIPIASKGILYHPNGYETALFIFTKSIPHLGNKAVCGDANQTFGLIVVSALPYCIQHFNAPTQLCANLAQSIATHCQNKLNEIVKNNAEINILDHPLNNLITMMGQYRERNFPRDHSQWVKCVVNYLLDSFTLDTFQLILILSEMLDRSPIQLHSTILDILLLLFTYGNLSDSSPVLLNSQVVRLISKHIHGSNSREASQILKLIVDHWNSISVNLVNNVEKKLLSSRKPDFELRFEKSVKETNIPKSLMDGNCRQKIREKLISLFALCEVPIGAAKSHHFSQSSTNLNATKQQEDKEKTLNNKNEGQNPEQQMMSIQALHPKDEFGLERMSSPNSLGPTIDHNSGGANSCELVSLRTTDSFPRVFKEFDFLEAEHDSISESTDSCFNWLSTMRTPRVCPENDNETAEGKEEEVPDDDEEYYEEEDDDLDSNNTKNSGGGNFSSPSSFGGVGGGGGGIDGRLSVESGESGAAHQRRNLFGRNNVGRRNKKRELMMPIRPMSGASDSNDISSDRTPIQSTHHSDESSSSSSTSYISEEEENAQEENNLNENRRQSSSEGTQEESTNRRQQQNIRENEENNGNGGKRRKQLAAKMSSTSATSSTKSPPIQAANISASNQQIQQQFNRQSNASSLVSLSLQTSSTTATFPSHLFDAQNQQHQFRSNSIVGIGTPSSRQFFHQDQMAVPALPAGISLRLECGHHISGIVEQLWNSYISRLEDDQDGEITSNSIMLFTQLLRENGTRLVGLLRDTLDSCRQLTMMDSPRQYQQQMNAKCDISSQLSNTLSMCIKLVDCPFLFISPHFLRSSNLLVTQKFALFELREHFDTFAEYREQTLRALNMVKSSQKLLLINNENSGNSGTGQMGDAATSSLVEQPVNNQQFGIRKQEFALFKSLHKLCFQLLIILEKLIDMIQTVQHSTNSQDSDLTPAVCALQRELLGHLSTSAATASSSASSSMEPFNSSSISSATGGGGGMCQSTNSASSSMDLCQSRDTLMLHTTNKQFRNAFNKLKQLRIQYSNNGGGGQFGCCEQTDVDILLLNFCRSHCSLRMWALVGASLEQLRNWCAHLKESNVQLGILVRNRSMLVQSQQSNEGQQSSATDFGQQTMMMENFM